MTRRLLNLFSGRQSGIQPFLDAGWEAVTNELEPRFPNTTFVGDLLEIPIRDIVDRGPYSFVWASAPCTSFSVGSFRHHWEAQAPCRGCRGVVRRASGEVWEHVLGTCDRPHSDGDLQYTPKSETGRIGQALLRRTLDIIDTVNPRWWVIENPRALMRKMPELAGVERKTITHCQYGDPRRQKPTDLFGVFPAGFEARACKNGAPCHEAAPRGAKTGTQGLKNAEERSLVPYQLPYELLQAIEAELQQEAA